MIDVKKFLQKISKMNEAKGLLQEVYWIENPTDTQINEMVVYLDKNEEKLKDDYLSYLLKKEFPKLDKLLKVS